MLKAALFYMIGDGQLSLFFYPTAGHLAAQAFPPREFAIQDRQKKYLCPKGSPGVHGCRWNWLTHNTGNCQWCTVEAHLYEHLGTMASVPAYQLGVCIKLVILFLKVNIYWPTRLKPLFRGLGPWKHSKLTHLNVALVIGNWQLGIGHLGILNNAIIYLSDQQKIASQWAIPNVRSNLYWISSIHRLSVT